MDIDDKIQSYFDKQDKFDELLLELREIIMNYPFEETLKWGMPTYAFAKQNLIGLGAFKNHVSIWFFQGALLKDKKGILQNAQEGRTKAMRQIRLNQISDINASLLNKYLEETIDNQRKGLKVQKIKSLEKIEFPLELSNYLKEHTTVADSFVNLTPGRQKEYVEFISSAKRPQTKLDRLKKITPLIMSGKGLNDKYKRNKKI